MLVVISYDVADDRRRSRLSKMLGNYGVRVLESVFECELAPAHLERLLGRLRRATRRGEDCWRCYQLCEACAGRTVADRPVERLPRAFVV